MLDHVSIGVRDIAAARRFYDAVLAPLGMEPNFATDRLQSYGALGEGSLAVCKPFDQKPASPGNGAMTALAAPSREVVDAVHAAAVAGGGACEGPPGARSDGFYAAYFRDLDGNKLCAFKMG